MLIIYDKAIDGSLFKGCVTQVTDSFKNAGINCEIYYYTDDQFLAEKISLIKSRKYSRIAIITGARLTNLIISLLKENSISIPLALFSDNDLRQHIFLNKEILIDELLNFAVAEEYQLMDLSFVNSKLFRKSVNIGCFADAYGIVGLLYQMVDKLAFSIELDSSEISYKGEALFLRVEPVLSELDGTFTVTLIKNCPLLEAINLFRAVKMGEEIESPYLISFKTDKLVVSNISETKICLDGERQTIFPLEFTFGRQRLYLQHFSLQTNDIRLSHRLTAAVYDFGHLDFVNYLRRNIVVNIFSTIWDIRRHNPFVYRNQNSISVDYFGKAEETLNDGFLYLILADTGSPTSELVRLYTKRTYAHISISFDPHLDTVVSYNGGFRTKRPGMHSEKINFFYQKPDASIIIYKLPATYQQKKKILEEIKRINREGSSFNFIGWQAEGSRNNIMFCSQFVYTLLEKVGLSYFTKNPARVRPTDFVELDNKQQLIFCNRFYVQDLINNSYLLEDADYAQERDTCVERMSQAQ